LENRRVTDVESKATGYDRQLTEIFKDGKVKLSHNSNVDRYCCFTNCCLRLSVVRYLWRLLGELSR